jgi:hypothetical protein
MEEALFRWIADGSEAESPALSDGDSLILVSIEDSRIVKGNIRVKNIQRAPVEVVLGEGATEGSGDGGDAERGAVRATFQVKNEMQPFTVNVICYCRSERKVGCGNSGYRSTGGSQNRGILCGIRYYDAEGEGAARYAFGS